MRVGSLFSGIGGLDLGLERAGMSVVWQCEADPYCRAVLRKHWPDVPCYEDVRAIGADVPAIDLLVGGFPCQPVSQAGHRKGTADDRWLWPHFARLIRDLRPRFVLVENVPGLLNANGGDAMGEVLRDLAACGYDAEWDGIPAAAVGAPHRRDRVWIVAYPNGGGHVHGQARIFTAEAGEPSQRQPQSGGALPHPNGDGRDPVGQGEARDEGDALAPALASGELRGARRGRPDSGPRVGRSGPVADPTLIGLEGRSNGDRMHRPQGGERAGEPGRSGRRRRAEDVADASSRQPWQQDREQGREGAGAGGRESGGTSGRVGQSGAGWWATEPDVGRVADGVPNRVDRLRALGNAVVPQVAEWIGRRIMSAAACSSQGDDA